jgi:TetR/AcrR family tetracycline transcriptional repressor
MRKKPTAASEQARVTLTQSDVIAAAHRLLDETGVDGWSMRMLARELSVSVSTLYWHVRDKRELLKILIDDSLRSIEFSDAGDWQERLAEFLRQGRNVLRARPSLIGLIWSSGWQLGTETLRMTNDVLGLVAESGTPEEEVADAYFMVVAFLFGFVAMETLSPDTPGFNVDDSPSAHDAASLPHLVRYRPAADMEGMDRRFERGVARIVRSLDSVVNVHSD